MSHGRDTTEARDAEQPILRTASGEIDFETYYDRARAVRAEAHRNMWATVMALWRHRIYRSGGNSVITVDRKLSRP